MRSAGLHDVGGATLSHANTRGMLTASVIERMAVSSERAFKCNPRSNFFACNRPRDFLRHSGAS
jgi:hypothetical protein